MTFDNFVTLYNIVLTTRNNIKNLLNPASMSLEKKVGACLASQDIRAWLLSGKIVSASLPYESRIQPSSFEPTVGDEIYILDTESGGVLRPKKEESIYRTLLGLPARRRQKVKIGSGFEIKRGFTYLAKLEEKVVLSAGEFVKSSPKSSCGRVFLNTRLLSDFNPCFDEMIAQYKVGSALDMWVLIQPLAFNLILHEGLSLNQLRFFTGHSAQLTPDDIVEEFKNYPLLCERDVDGSLVPIETVITDDLHIHLDFSGERTQGIVGLRARHNPVPIDMGEKEAYDAEHFFEPVVFRGEPISVERGEYYLFASKEILCIPPHLNVELRPYSHIGFTGPLHFAGFIDNGFRGDLVFEVRSDEVSRMVLEDGMPISKLDIFRTPVPDKLYGKDIGSHYQGQVGCKPSKNFRSFDYTYAAKNYKKLDREVLVQDAKLLLGFRKLSAGFEFAGEEDVSGLIEAVSEGFFQSRYDCETDETILQPIPYVLVFSSDMKVFSYVRANNIADYGDARLFGKHSIGLGGHIIKGDAPYFVYQCIRREVFEEEVDITGSFTKPKLVGTLMAYDTPVDRVHFGLIFGIIAEGVVMPKESSIISGRMFSIEEILHAENVDKRYETWSRIIIPHLDMIYKLASQKSSR